MNAAEQERDAVLAEALARLDAVTRVGGPMAGPARDLFFALNAADVQGSPDAEMVARALTGPALDTPRSTT